MVILSGPSLAHLWLLGLDTLPFRCWLLGLLLLRCLLLCLGLGLLLGPRKLIRFATVALPLVMKLRR